MVPPQSLTRDNLTKLETTRFRPRSRRDDLLRCPTAETFPATTPE